MSEQELKESKVRALLAEKSLDALWLRRVSSFAWATCGASSYINTASEYGEASLLYTPHGRYVIANNIETPRLDHEEGLRTQGWEFATGNWYEPDHAVESLTKGLRVGADGPFPGATDLSAEMAQRRAQLTSEEGERFRELGRLCAQAMRATVDQVLPGQTEHEIAALLARETEARGAWPVVDLVATDERVYKFRHPLPTGKRLDRYAMLVLCGRRRGLVCSITRLVHFGALPDQLRQKQQAVARVDAAFIAATRPGAILSDIFAHAAVAYEQDGFADEWRLHHQGGPAGYEPREYLGTPSSNDTVTAGQAYAWNPSITGVKSEDTFLVGAENNKVLTEIPDWPAIQVEIGGQSLARPAILEVH